MELNTFKIVSENYKNQEKNSKKNTNKTKKHPHIIAYSLERKITNIFQMHKKYIKTLLILYNMHKRKNWKLAKRPNCEKKVKIVL